MRYWYCYLQARVSLKMCYQQLWFCCKWMIGFNNILHSAWLQTKDFSCKNQESCSMVGIVESGLWWPHHSVERRLCLVWPQWSVCWGPNRGTERRSGVVRAGPLPGLVLVDGSSIQGCVSLHRGGLTLHRGGLYLHGVVVRTGYPWLVLKRIDLH